jgi:hypothetical protein
MVFDFVNRTSLRGSSAGAAVALVVFVFVSALPADASASKGYARTWAGVMGANVNTASERGQWGPGLELGFGAGITDFWSVIATAQGSYHLALEDEGIDAAPVAALGAGFRYNLDVFKYVPYLGLAVNTFVVKPAPGDGALRGDVSLRGTIGCDWRYDRNWSVGVKVDIHSPLTAPGNFPIYSTAGINLAYHFRL